ncbi:haloacid dehalogenase type II [Amaricoccus solimangrovi]|uniref:(S)-2-haloacid dehalogenase n=1 Tax=Amaricoccus solimangrovi TaxID=2589815 RepID=A0A501WL16_9RHOB|nr:haloacid dehalogenase type II [Amaricoccus solimangrovi]TPE50199.1 haloacid dehalogenase type II [Amaricoccus solimangrovi]
MFRAIVFDAYGTLFDVDAAARHVAAEPGRHGFAAVWPRVSADWRRKQLEYTWLRAITGTHADFWQVTRESLDWALEAAGMAGHDLRERLLALYWELDAFPEAAEVLDGLRGDGFATAILSNGTPELIEAAVRHAGLADRFDALISVEEAGVYKPSPKVYDLATARFGCKPDEILFVSSNGWDACSAAGHGFRTVWVNRGRAPAERLAAAPDRETHDLTGVLAVARGEGGR